MTAPPGHPRQADSALAPKASQAPSITGPVLLWLTVQLMALLLAVVRVPLAAHQPQPAELLAAQVMVVVQVTAAALLFPYLLHSMHSTAVVVATACPFLVLSGVLSGVPAARLVVAGSYVFTWIIALWALKASIPASTRPVGVVAATLLTSGTLIAFYLIHDFAAHAAGDAGGIAVKWRPLSVPLTALKLMSAPLSSIDWCAPGLVLGMVVARRLSGLRSSQVIHKP